MTVHVSLLPDAVAVGVLATAIMDVWVVTRSRILRAPALSYALVGRWLVYLARGQFRHDRIDSSPPVPGELVIGWVAHYLTGIVFATVLLTIWGIEWLRNPTLGPALIVGIGSVLAPFLLMQPAMGAGIAASRMPRPTVARVNSVMTHCVFGLGLYVAGWIMKRIGL